MLEVRDMRNPYRRVESKKQRMNGKTDKCHLDLKAVPEREYLTKANIFEMSRNKLAEKQL